MSDTNKRCWTCRYYGEDMEVKDGGYCLKTLPTNLPQWARFALEEADRSLLNLSGMDCNAWELKL